MVGGAADPASLAGGDVSLIWVFFPRSICARDLGIFFLSIHAICDGTVLIGLLF